MAGRGVDIILGGKAPDPGQYEKEGEDPQYRKEYENWEADHRKGGGLGGLHDGGTARHEGFHFDMRKHLVEYDDVVNKHREVIYQQRKLIIGKTDRNEAPENIRDWVGALGRSYLSH